MHGLGIQFRGRVARQVRNAAAKHDLGVLRALLKCTALLPKPTLHLAAGHDSRVYEFVNYGKRGVLHFLSLIMLGSIRNGTFVAREPAIRVQVVPVLAR